MCVQCRLGFSALSALYQNTRLTQFRNFISNVQAAILLVFRTDVSYSFVIYSDDGFIIMVFCCSLLFPAS